MKVIYSIILAALILSGCNPFAGSSPAVLVVDLDAVAKASGRQESMQKELEFANVRLSEQLKLVASQLENAVADEKDKIGEKPSADERQQFDDLLLQAQKQLQNSKQLAVQQANVFRSELIIEFRQEVADIAQQIALDRHSKIVMVTNFDALWFDPAADITDEVIAVMRARPLSSDQQEAPSEVATTPASEQSESP